MTFEEWWHENESALRFGIDFIAHRVLTGAELKESNEQMKRIANDVWQASQPKWTYCKDRYPTEVDGEVKKGCIGFRKNLRLVGVIGLSRDSDFGFEVTFNLTENHFESDDKEVIAWMSLPEIPGNIDK